MKVCYKVLTYVWIRSNLMYVASEGRETHKGMQLDSITMNLEN
ncbi:hypothetical protein GGGNBK_01490 [Sporosarcina sp. ANT_H38]